MPDKEKDSDIIKDLMNTIKLRSLELSAHYVGNIKIEINVNNLNKNVKVNVTEYDL